MQSCDRQLTFNDLGDSPHSRTTFKFLLERCQGDLVRFRVNFHLSVVQIADETFYFQSLRCPQRKVSIPNALHPAANKIMFRTSHYLLCAFCGYSSLPRVVTTARFALFHAAMPPTTFDTFR